MLEITPRVRRLLSSDHPQHSVIPHPVANCWTTGPSLPTGTFWHSSAALGNDIHLVGGDTTPNQIAGTDQHFVLSVATSESCVEEYAERFSTDPAWVTDQPDNYYWDAGAQAYHATTVNAQPGPSPTRYAYTLVNYSGGSFRLEFDINPMSLEWSAGMSFGLFDANLAITPSNSVPNPHNIFVHPHRSDAGLAIPLYVRGLNGVSHVEHIGWNLFSEGVWYHCIVQYDQASDGASLTVTERSTGNPVGSAQVTNIGGFPGDMDYLGFATDPDGSCCPVCPGWSCSTSGTALLDNVTLFNCTGGTGGCTTDAECDDGLGCNGLETCQTPGANGHCVGGTPVNCDDNDTCTSDTCVEPAGTCEHSSNGTCGACCNTLAGTCTDNRVQADCLSENAAQRVWTPGRTCGEVPCDAVLGACCDHDPFGACTSTTLAQCQGGKLEWTKLASCANINCEHGAIPTVSEWGLVVLTLLLLTGAKVYFGGRRIETA